MQLQHPNDQLEHSLFSAWLTAAGIGMCVVDDTARVVMLNPAACSMLNVDGLAMLNKPLTQLLKSIEGDASLIQWLAAPGFDGEKYVTRKGIDISFDLLLKSTTVRANGANGMGSRYKVIAITDITELLTAQRQVDSESYRRQWQALNAGVVISDARSADMPIVYVNPMFESMSGYTSAEVVGRNCRYLQGQDTNQPGLTAIRTAIRNQTNGYAQLRNYRKDGSMFVNELFISPIKDNNGTVTHFVGIQHLQVAKLEAVAH